MVAIPTLVATIAGTFCSSFPGLCTQPGGCDLSGIFMPLSPDQQTTLGLPTTPLAAIGLGFGVQNYTCSADNVFVSTGAVGEVFDISCLASSNSSLLSTIHDDLFSFWYSSETGNVTVQQLIETLPNTVVSNAILGQHYFIDNGAGGISPVWDSRAIPQFQGVADAVFVGNVVANTPDANPTENVSWLHLVEVSGNLADEVYRAFTAGGIPPSTCVSGTTQDISVKYVSQYWFFGGSLGLGSPC